MEDVISENLKILYPNLCKKERKNINIFDNKSPLAYSFVAFSESQSEITFDFAELLAI